MRAPILTVVLVGLAACSEPTVGRVEICTVARDANGSDIDGGGTFAGTVVAEPDRLFPRTRHIGDCAGAHVFSEEVITADGTHVAVELIDDATAARRVTLAPGSDVTVALRGPEGFIQSIAVDIVDGIGALLVADFAQPVDVHDDVANLHVNSAGNDGLPSCGVCGCGQALKLKFGDGAQSVDLGTNESAKINVSGVDMIVQNNAASTSSPSGRCTDGTSDTLATWSAIRSSLVAPSD